jgi:hypothetical protein
MDASVHCSARDAESEARFAACASSTNRLRSSALGDDQSDIVMLFVRTEAADFIYDC